MTYEEALMKPQFKSNNFIAIIIALMLFAVGFLLLFIHQQSESSQAGGQTKTSCLPEFPPSIDHSFVDNGLIRPASIENFLNTLIV